MSWDLKDTHKNFWECDTGIAFLVSGVKTWRIRRMTEVFDLSDPTKPVKIRDFGLDGQQPGTTGAVPERAARRGLDRQGRQPALFRLRHQQGRHSADRRSREAPEWTEGADAGEPEISGDRPSRHEPDARRAHHHAARQDQDRRVRQGQGQGRARLRHDRRRGLRQRMWCSRGRWCTSPTPRSRRSR